MRPYREAVSAGEPRQSLLAEIEAASRPAGLPCGIRALLDTLPADDRADLEAALASASIYGSTIARVLTARGWKVSEQTIRRHRSGACRCRGSEKN